MSPTRHDREDRQRAAGVRAWARFRRQELRRNFAVGVLLLIILGLLILLLL